MSYNYPGFGSTYGQQYPSSYNAQPTTGTTGYGQSSYGSASTTSSSTTSSGSSYGFGSAATSTSMTQAQNASSYGYSGQAQGTAGYSYGYSDSSSGFTAPSTQNNALQAFQQSWYSGGSGVTSTTSQPTAATTARHPAQQQQQQYAGNYQNQYMQHYQQYQQQQYAASNTASSQQAMFKSPQPVGTKPRTGQSTATGKIEQQSPTSWGAYNQNPQRQVPNNTTNRADTTNKASGWGAYQQPQTAMSQSPVSSNQPKTAEVVYRSPMKYTQPTDNQSYQAYNTANSNQTYNATNQGYKPANMATTQGFNTSNQSYNNQSQSYNNTTPQNFASNQNYPSMNQGYNVANQQYKNPPTGGYNATGYGANQNYGNNYSQGYAAQNYNKGFGQGSSNRSEGNSVGRSPSGPPPKPPPRPMEPPFQPYQPQQGGMMGQGRGGPMNMASRGRGGVRPLMGRGGPIGGNMSYPGLGRPGPPQDGPDIPPFPQAWHSQEFEGPGEWQRGQAGFGVEGPNRWNRGGGNQRGRFGQQSPQQRGMYNSNSRNPRGSFGTNRELWSPAGKKSGPPTPNDKELKPPLKKEDNETADKDKQTEIKSFLYAWLGSRHSRPVYDIRQNGERPNISFRCDLRVEGFQFVGVGEAANKKESQTAAAWDFADFLIKSGELEESDLPERQPKLSEDFEEEFGTVKEPFEESSDRGRSRDREDDGFRGRDRRGDRDMGRRGRWGNQSQWGGRARPNMMRNEGRIPPPMMEIRPLMAHPVGPWEGPIGMPRPPHMMPPPAMMDYGPGWNDGWGLLGPAPNMPIRPGFPLPPMMRRNQNEYWRRRDMEERMYDMKWNQGDWQSPEDIFINQMIKNQQESERHHGMRAVMAPPLEAMPGEWHSVAQSRPVVTSDDRHVMTKHAEIYPQEGELKNLHRIVNTVEQALKLLSDKFVDEDHPREEVKKEEKETKETKESTEEKPQEEVETKQESKEKKDGEEEDDKDKNEAEKEENKDEKRAKIKILKRPKKAPKQVDTRPRVLCGVNRIGPLAKGLLITKDDRVDLALLCGEIPTVTLLDRIMAHVAEKLTEVDEDFKLSVDRLEDEAGFLVKSVDETSPVQVMVTLTATALRKQGKKDRKQDSKNKGESEKKENEEEKEEKSMDAEEEKKEEEEEMKVEEPDLVGMLSKQKMLDALACLRHTHWFQSKACGVQSCVILTRILRDLQRRDETWMPLGEWPLEVLIFDCLVSSEEQMSPGDACRRFLEVVSGGILLPGLPGLQDPCEKTTRDVLDCLNTQQREDMTRNAQDYLRKLAFREVHKFLGMEKLPPNFKMASETRSSQNNHDRPFNRSAELRERDERSGESNNVRKRRFEHNTDDSVAESPKRSLTDEEDTDTQQNLAELSISDEASEGRSALLDEEAEATGKYTQKAKHNKEADESELLVKQEDNAMETAESEMTKEEEDALLDEKMDT